MSARASTLLAASLLVLGACKQTVPVTDKPIDTDPPDTELPETDVVETDAPDTDLPPRARDRVGVSGGGGVVTDGTYTLAVSVGDPITVHERTDGTYVLRLGIGTTQLTTSR